MSRRKRFELDVKHNSTFTLNITSMADMFTLLLVFLLQNFATNPVEIKPIDGLRLPTSNTYKNPIISIQVSISTKEIRVGEKVIAQVRDRDVASGDIDPQDTNFIQPLFKELQAVAQDPNLKKEEKNQIMLQADEGLPYQTVRKVLYTASMAGFPQVKLVTVVGN
ncbi:MAG: biopolymer transporter ExbD [Bdellovibrionales bacterium]